MRRFKMGHGRHGMLDAIVTFQNGAGLEPIHRHPLFSISRAEIVFHARPVSVFISETRECLCFSSCLATLGLPRMPEVFNFSSFLIVCGDAATKTVRTGYFILGFSRTDSWIQGTLGFAL